MTGVVTRPALPEELAGLWPAVRAHRIFDSEEAFFAFAEECAWCVRLDGRGDAAIVDRWREWQDVLAVRALWAPPHHIPAWIDELASVGAPHGFGALLSPLLPVSRIEPWTRAGMELVERLVGFQALAGDVAPVPMPEGVTIERAASSDLPAIEAVDRASFDGFWRFSVGDLERAGRGERVVVARRNDRVLGYTLCTIGRGVGVLVRLAVAPEARRQGVGRALLSDCAQYAARAGAVTLTLCTQESNRASRALYARAGMTEVEERYALAIARFEKGTQ